MAALMASRSVLLAMSLMTVMRDAISFMACTISPTALPLSVALLAARVEMFSVTLALSAFWLTVAVISSTEALVCSTLEASSEEVWERALAVAATCSEAEPMASDMAPTSLRVSERRWAMLLIA